MAHTRNGNIISVTSSEIVKIGDVGSGVPGKMVIWMRYDGANSSSAIIKSAPRGTAQTPTTQRGVKIKDGAAIPESTAMAGVYIPGGIEVECAGRDVYLDVTYGGTGALEIISEPIIGGTATGA